MTSTMRRLEEQRQEGAGQQQDDEAVERDLAEHERPVVGEDLAELLLEQGPATAGAVVQEDAGLADGRSAGAVLIRAPRSSVRRAR